ncbi:MAG: hypothetical protein ABIP96_00725 [Patescibacteria group bacterium]
MSENLPTSSPEGDASKPKKPRAVIGFGKLTMGSKIKAETAKTMVASEEGMSNLAKAEVPMMKSAEEQAEEKAQEAEIEKENEIARAAFREKMAKRMEAEAVAKKADSEYVKELREKMGLTQHTGLELAKKSKLAVNNEELERIQQHADTVEVLRAQAKGVQTLGGELEKPMTVGMTGKSETSFEGFEEERESSPAMFSLAEMERQEAENAKKKKPGERAA